jgi:hypothetical protein
VPYGGVTLRLDRTASGAVYVGLSGNVTMNSGTLFLSGGAASGVTDGFPINPGGSFNVPNSMLVSGEVNVFVWHDAACSGQARLFFDPIFGR